MPGKDTCALQSASTKNDCGRLRKGFAGLNCKFFLHSDGMPNAIAHQVYVGIGSNVVNKKKNFFEAVARLAKLPETKVIKESSLYESEPLGDAKDWYVNGAIEIATKF